MKPAFAAERCRLRNGAADEEAPELTCPSRGPYLRRSLARLEGPQSGGTRTKETNQGSSPAADADHDADRGANCQPELPIAGPKIEAIVFACVATGLVRLVWGLDIWPVRQAWTQ